MKWKIREKKTIAKPTIIRSDSLECWLKLNKSVSLSVTLSQWRLWDRKSDSALNTLGIIHWHQWIVHRKSLVWNIAVFFHYFRRNKHYIPAYRAFIPKPRSIQLENIHSTIIVVQLKYHFCAFHQVVNVLLIA